MFAICGNAQHTLLLPKDADMPKASITDVAWISGYWKGTSSWGDVEEMWSKPMGGSMMFSFRMIVDNTVNMYEVGHIVEQEGSLVLQLKHFDADLNGWEEKDEVQSFKLVKLEDKTVYFDGITYMLNKKNELTVFVRSEEEGNPAQELEFNFRLEEE